MSPAAPAASRGPRAYADRVAAGRVLAGALADYRGRGDVVVLALPRGGVPVAAAVAEFLGAPLDVLLVRKLGLPGQPELAMGAIAAVEGEVEIVRNDSVLRSAHVRGSAFTEVLDREQAILADRERRYRGDRPPAVLSGSVVILVDDGLATGSTMRAAIAAVRRRRPARVVVAVPVGATRTCALLAREVDEVVCPLHPEPFRAVGQVYDDFSPTSEDEVREALNR
jgi:putative phosphoribosyl transferase